MKFRQRVKYFLIRKITKLLIDAIVLTCRIKIIGEETVTELREKKIPIIYIYWHRHILFTIYKFKKTGARPLISLSPDGEIAAQIAEEFGMNPVRGSSSKGGARAFLKLAGSIKDEREEILITADGPKGPARQIKDGTIVLAQKTGSVIVPFSWYSGRVKILEKTWDRFIIPLPFSTITFKYGAPFFIDPKKRRGELGALKKELQDTLNILQNELEKGD
jgi:lysophospholipid acyltransferase (LPLAT)-like uncharacterized protein